MAFAYGETGNDLQTLACNMCHPQSIGNLVATANAIGVMHRKCLAGPRRPRVQRGEDGILGRQGTSNAGHGQHCTGRCEHYGWHVKPTALITGATSGIGLATARLLQENGWQVIATARNHAKAAQLQALLPHAVIEIADFDDPAAVDILVARLPAHLDALVNNAGYALPGAIEDVSAEAAQRQYQVNVFAPILLARAVIPRMRAAGGGRIVNVSSVSGLISGPMLGWYSSSKHALESLSDALRLEVRPFNISVSLIEPNSFGTDIWSRASGLFPDTSDSAYADIYRRAERMLGRTYPEPTPVARAIMSALTDQQPKPRYLVGQGTRIFPLLRRLPTRWSDYLISTSLGLHRPHPIVRRILRMIGA